MVKESKMLFLSIQIIFIVFMGKLKRFSAVLVLLVGMQVTNAQSIPSNQLQYATEMGSKVAADRYVEVPANIIYPTLLKAELAQSIDYVEKFAKNRAAYLARMYVKGKKYFPKVLKILGKHHLPSEYHVLLALESAFNAKAISSAGAVGYWQIMDEVAKEYGLQYIPQPTAAEKLKAELAIKNGFTLSKSNTNGTVLVKNTIQKDDRNHFIKSTNAAARYLKDRTKNLGNNLLLIVASYNCGIGNVWEAQRKTGITDASFWQIKKYLPAETQAYVMNFICLNVLFYNYQKFANHSLTFHPTYKKVQENCADEQTITVGKISD